MGAPARNPVVADQMRVEHQKDAVLLSCRVRAHGGELPAELWFRLPVAAAPFVDVAGDAFLPPLLLHCMWTGVPLVIDADVSTLLLSSVSAIQDIYCAWAEEHGDALTRVEVGAAERPRERLGEASAAFFSGGVDSFYTLLRNVRRYPSGDSRCIRHLVLVHGFDVPLTERALFDRVEQQARSAAQRFTKDLLVVATNIRAATHRLDWAHYGHGAALAAVGLVLGRLVHTVFIPATSAFVDLTPWGSHPALDPLWSTEAVEFVNDGGEARREEKVRLIASSAIALQSLRVCWENRGGAYNCCRCEKCLRTMIELEICGALQRAAQFPEGIDAAAVERLTIPPGCRKHWSRMLARRERLTSPELAAAIEAALGRRGSIRARYRSRAAPLRRRLAQFGLTPARLGALGVGLSGRLRNICGRAPRRRRAGD